MPQKTGFSNKNQGKENLDVSRKRLHGENDSSVCVLMPFYCIDTQWRWVFSTFHSPDFFELWIQFQVVIMLLLLLSLFPIDPCWLGLLGSIPRPHPNHLR
jgi:hypothetical protein